MAAAQSASTAQAWLNSSAGGRDDYHRCCTLGHLASGRSSMPLHAVCPNIVTWLFISEAQDKDPSTGQLVKLTLAGPSAQFLWVPRSVASLQITQAACGACEEVARCTTGHPCSQRVFFGGFAQVGRPRDRPGIMRGAQPQHAGSDEAARAGGRGKGPPAGAHAKEDSCKRRKLMAVSACLHLLPPSISAQLP